MQTNNNEQLIYLKDLCFCVLYSWKKIIILAIALAVLLGGWKGLSTYRSANAFSSVDTSAYQEDLDSYNEEKAVLESKLESVQHNFDGLSSYIDESILMQIDPYRLFEVSMSFYVDTDYQVNPTLTYQTPDRSLAILNAYSNLITGDDFMQMAAEALQTQVTYLPELFTLEIPQNANTLRLSILFPTEENAQTILSLLEQKLPDMHDNITEAIAPHSIKLIQSNVRQTSNTNLIELQASREQRLLDLLASVDTLENSIASLTMPQVHTSLTAGTIVKSAVSFAVIGGFAGVFIGILAAWICHIGSGKVYSARTLANRTQVKVIGCLNAEEKQCSITRLIRKLDGRNLTDSQVQAKLLSSNVRNLCADSKHLLVVCSAESAALAQALQQTMPNMQLTVCGSLLSDIDAIDALAQCDRVLLVEKCNASKYAQVQQSIDLIADNNKTLLGCILLNG